MRAHTHKQMQARKRMCPWGRARTQQSWGFRMEHRTRRIAAGTARMFLLSARLRLRLHRPRALPLHRRRRGGQSIRCHASSQRRDSCCVLVLACLHSAQRRLRLHRPRPLRCSLRRPPPLPCPPPLPAQPLRPLPSRPRRPHPLRPRRQRRGDGGSVVNASAEQQGRVCWARCQRGCNGSGCACDVWRTWRGGRVRMCLYIYIGHRRTSS